MEFKGNIAASNLSENTSYLTDTGSANAYAVAIRPAITAYTTGLKVVFQAANANTGASTLAVNGLAAKTIKKNVATDLQTGDIIVNSIIVVIYDGTNFQLVGGTGIGINKVYLTYSNPLDEIAGTIVNKAGTITGTAGVGSSLFLQRLMIPAPMALTEIDAAMSIAFPVTSQGAGTMSRSMAIYSFGNSTSLASIMSKSGASIWSTGTSTTAGAVSLTQFQGGWSSPLIQPMTFAASTIDAGEYVVGQLFDFAQASSTWTINFYGAQAINTFLASAATNLTSATLGALSSGGLLAGSVHTASASSSLTAWSAAPSVVNAMSSTGLIAGSGITGISSYGAAFIALSTAGSFTNFILSQTVSSATSSVSLLLSSGNVGLSLTNTAKSISFQLAGISSNSNILSSVGTVAGSIHSASGSGVALSNAGTSAFAGFLGSSGLLAGSFLTNSGSLGAVTNVALGALNSSTVAQLTLPNFGYIGTGSTTSNFPTIFYNGIMSTGAIPTAITLTSTAVTYSGSVAFQIPWFQLVGS